MGIQQRVVEFSDFANSLDSGCLTEYKAGCMLIQLEAMPHLLDHFGCCMAFVQNCLRADGFSDRACYMVADYLKKLEWEPPEYIIEGEMVTLM
ncbi:hypothetical protein PHIM7_275 [Sinorhizobium phage phiM7]|uniref:Uncharacterized protein n=3 Tax=Emdodecavirus TaxID=1980937 RepID=S5MDF5_9CAUD|nr:hypothetical protein AB690_gp233 [Sinorhizobium phage phiM12]YP_009212520.1 hypothetical protein AVT40_gp253 [Sinorhizobium phage phiN3]YP_009601400.1 hypothetical protein FDH46_gp203 [Sinorhizobium phage phiM7]AKF13181.1 hypothetical protein PHIM19_276 [Sinorhizobium phage phiM19]AGR47994.1 hypothetical protein SmphiM12_362 [Sinorhizobium phage phiM12]AKF12820.1 hypothetical protein PHIM7_275 [Sinorhizobium phage phiM7]AKF13543.1 hypothetical protein PHIN3_280 [Sinorhizobium phage phiN3]